MADSRASDEVILSCRGGTRFTMPERFVELANAAKSAVVDASALADALRRSVRGEVRFDDGSRALYATDGSNYRQVPIGVVIPRNVDAVMATISLCLAHGAPVLPL